MRSTNRGSAGRRDAGDVRGEEDVGHRAQRRLGRQRLGVDDVEAGHEVAPSQPVDQGVRVDDRAARHVDEHRARASSGSISRRPRRPADLVVRGTRQTTTSDRVRTLSRLVRSMSYAAASTSGAPGSYARTCTWKGASSSRNRRPTLPSAMIPTVLPVSSPLR
jgi:hypothetical protein